MYRVATLAATLIVGGPTAAWACGCLSPPEPQPETVDFAVNQQSEQIIFEVEPGFVTAHVHIRYAGDPASFAWIVPVPAVPELEISHESAFAVLDPATRPRINIGTTSRCPDPLYRCEHHPFPQGCIDLNPTPDASAAADASPGGAGGAGGGAGGQGGGGGGNSPPVEVFQRERVGDYETVVLGGGDAQAIVEWLQTERFVVNDTMSPFMQPYLDAGMLFVASKLVPGADADSIKPLKMRYAADAPMIPLQLTAVAAEPHLTVTAYVYGQEPFVPRDQPLVQVQPEWLALRTTGGNNYPAALSRASDAADGRGFVREYAGRPPRADFSTRVCCDGGGSDYCGIGGDGQCQCPDQEFDVEDCAEAAPGLREGIDLVNGLNEAYPVVTRLTVRLSPEEMTFDPVFLPDPAARQNGPLTLENTMITLRGCDQDVVDRAAYDRAVEAQVCAGTWCGEGECVVLDDGAAACRCEEGFVARRYRDLDGLDAVTCVPDTPPVDLSAGGIEVPDPCTADACLAGECLDVGGFAACGCPDGTAAAVNGNVLRCGLVQHATGNPGALDFSAPLRDLEVCAPAVSSCGRFGWLVANDRLRIRGSVCPQNEPPMRWFEEPPPPTCEDYGLRSPGAGAGGGEGGAGGRFDSGPGAGGAGGAVGADDGDDGDDDGCVVGFSNAPSPWWALIPLGLWGARRRRRPTS